jgi:hypothetical protein
MIVAVAVFEVISVGKMTGRTTTSTTRTIAAPVSAPKTLLAIHSVAPVAASASASAMPPPEQQDRPPIDVDEVLPLDGVREDERRDRVQPDHHVVQQSLVSLHAEQRRPVAAVEGRPDGVGDPQADQAGRPLEQPLQPADHPQRRRHGEDVRHSPAARGEIALLP